MIRVGVRESERLYTKIRWSSLTAKIVDSDANMAATEILSQIGCKNVNRRRNAEHKKSLLKRVPTAPGGGVHTFCLNTSTGRCSYVSTPRGAAVNTECMNSV